MRTVILVATLIALVLPAIILPAASQAAEGGGLGGIDHFALTVSNVNASESFFTRQLGFNVERRDTGHPAVYLTNGHVVVVLYAVAQLGTEVPFDRKRNVGLHHLAFAVESFDELDALHAQLGSIPGVVIEFAPELLGKGPAKHMIIREPGGNRIEFIFRPASGT
jgi:lactoylglutathione lyase